MRKVFLITLGMTAILPASKHEIDDAFTPQFKPTILVSQSLGEIAIDGELTDSGWASAAAVSGFSEVHPGENTSPSVETEVKLTYSSEFLYVAFLAYDDPSEVRASLRNRDQAFMDDWVGIILDTYDDATSGLFLISNPLGIQMDMMFKDGRDEDANFDVIFESKGRITDDGYQVEMAIPFSSLRFPESQDQSWRVTFIRNHPRDQERKFAWSAIDRNDPCMLCQLGYLEGIAGIESTRSVEFLPALVGGSSGNLSGDGAWDRSPNSGEISLGIRYPLSQGATAELALNPDFSQVEADAAQVDVNTTFALFYPEKRPFFNEGSDLFQMFSRVVYTRSINNPLIAGRLTGKVGKTAYAYLTALDETTPTILPFEEFSRTLKGGRSVSNILRAKHALDESSYVGGIVTDRRLMDGGAGSVAGVDGVYRFSKNYSLDFQFLASRTEEPVDSAATASLSGIEFGAGHTAGFDGEVFTGNSLVTELQREGRTWAWEAGYSHTSPTFRADNGFITSNNRKRLNANMRWMFFPDNRWIGFGMLMVGFEQQQNFDGIIKDQGTWMHAGGEFRGQTWMGFFLRQGMERFRDTDFDGLVSFNFNFNTRFIEQFSAGGNIGFGDGIVKFLSTPEVADRFNYSLRFTVKPWRNIVIGPSYTYSEMTDKESGEDYFSGYLIRTGFQYQFTPALSFRMIAQYNDFNNSFDYQPLLSWQPNPFTIFYVGTSEDYLGEENPSFSDMSRTSQQLFVKFQYLFN